MEPIKPEEHKLSANAVIIRDQLDTLTELLNVDVKICDLKEVRIDLKKMLRDLRANDSNNTEALKKLEFKIDENEVELMIAEKNRKEIQAFIYEDIEEDRDPIEPFLTNSEKAAKLEEKMDALIERRDKFQAENRPETCDDFHRTIQNYNVTLYNLQCEVDDLERASKNTTTFL